MGIFDLFNADKRALFTAKADYEHCAKDRRARLNSFRIKAREFLSFKYSGSITLINNHFPIFILFDKNTGKIHQGEFADNYSPFLEFVPYDANLTFYTEAVHNYRIQQGKWKNGELCQKHKCSKFNKNFERDFLKNGFYIKDVYRRDDPIGSEDFFGFTLFLNGNVIAESTMWDQKPSGHFAECIFNQIINNKHKNSSGFSMLTFVAGVFTLANENNEGCTNPNRIQYEIIFGNGDPLSDPKFNSDAKQAILSLRDFLSFHENKMNDDMADIIDPPAYLEEERKLCNEMLRDPHRKKNFPGIEDMYVRS
ncbi:hypothetical protein ABU178_19495 [Pantoea osteomyelitidis]|uniref:Uncharacterized protein n=1 Tax=Pantoea osteomyelitidis TaxID=3230026 RepID=A0ABW7Q178_9GAMM